MSLCDILFYTWCTYDKLHLSKVNISDCAQQSRGVKCFASPSVCACVHSQLIASLPVFTRSGVRPPVLARWHCQHLSEYCLLTLNCRTLQKLWSWNKWDWVRDVDHGVMPISLEASLEQLQGFRFQQGPLPHWQCWNHWDLHWQIWDLPGRLLYYMY